MSLFSVVQHVDLRNRVARALLIRDFIFSQGSLRHAITSTKCFTKHKNVSNPSISNWQIANESCYKELEEEAIQAIRDDRDGHLIRDLLSGK